MDPRIQYDTGDCNLCTRKAEKSSNQALLTGYCMQSPQHYYKPLDKENVTLHLLWILLQSPVLQFAGWLEDKRQAAKPK